MEGEHADAEREGMQEDEYFVENVVNKRIDRRSGEVKYEVKWAGYPDEDNTTEKLDNLLNSLESVKEFEKAQHQEIRVDLNTRDRNINHEEVLPAVAKRILDEVLAEASRGETSIIKVISMSYINYENTYLVLWDNQKITPMTAKDIKVLFKLLVYHNNRYIFLLVKENSYD